MSSLGDGWMSRHDQFLGLVDHRAGPCAAAAAAAEASAAVVDNTAARTVPAVAAVGGDADGTFGGTVGPVAGSAWEERALAVHRSLSRDRW